ncbi:hypothetical protein [Acidihalobacter prosperus]|uniref:Uncharacterized protein n=1 Tax=Acidihalobacter prosperus TaxID=160660 RepID=A0A1A6C326_9GAMM|nr:hypothetical protein [Acidihalobacter prosperus]OBS08959.1 hypothetical protein Thpro_022076 [Acidihalobacter prosperus]
MTMIKDRENPIVAAFFNLYSRDRRSPRVYGDESRDRRVRPLAVLKARFDALYAKDPDLAEAKVWEAADRIGLSSEEVHGFLAGYRYN